MKKTVIASVLTMTIGIVMGVFLVSNISPDFISDIFAQDNSNIGAKKAPITMTDRASVINETLVNASETVLPTVVSISVEVEKSSGFSQEFHDFFRFFGEPEDETYRTRGAGSGVIISEDGYIVTNNHVIEDAIEGGIEVTTNSRKVYEAELIGRDPLTDLAVLKIDADGLTPVHFGSMDKVRIGEMVLAVGNPLGLNSTVTSGIISAVGRGNIGLLRSSTRSSYAVEHFIQTDAAINPGNSGGGLFNLEGSLVGINTAIATGTGAYIGYGFAIPVNMVESVTKDLIDDGEINRGYIGVRIRTIDEIEAKSLGLESIEGVLVESVIEGSAAAAAGLQSEDVIIELDGKPLSTSHELQSEIVYRSAGDKVKLTIWRDGKRLNKTVTLKAKGDGDDLSFVDESGTKRKVPNTDELYEFEKLGFSVKPLDNKARKELDVDHGVIIAKVKQYSHAAERGMVPNGVIHEAARQKIHSVEDLKKILSSKSPGDAIHFQVKYPEMNRIIAMEIPG